MAEKLLTVDDVARLFQVSADTVYRWKRSGWLPGTKVAGTIRFRREDVDALFSPSHVPSRAPDAEPSPEPTETAQGDTEAVS